MLALDHRAHADRARHAPLHRVDGIHDHVEIHAAETRASADDDRRAGNGFTTSVDAAGLVDALHRGVRALRHGGRRAAIQSRGMTTDWSWDGPAAEHLELYRALVRE